MAVVDCASPAPAGSVAPGGTFFAITAVSVADIWAVGSVSNAHTDVARTLAAHWDGRRWRVVPSPNAPGRANALSAVAAVSATDIWAVGNTRNNRGGGRLLVEHWDGQRWRIVPAPTPTGINSTLSGLAVISGRDVWAVGTVFNMTGQDQTLAEQWDGQHWRIVPTPSPNLGLTGTPGLTGSALARVVALSSHDVWAVGTVFNSPGESQTLVEQWNGRRWRVVPSPPRPAGENSLTGVAAISAQDIWAVGSLKTVTGLTHPLVEHWNGVRWGVARVPALGTRSSALDVVVAIAHGDVWTFGPAGSTVLNPSRTVAVHWDGTAWHAVPSPGAGIPASATAVSAANIWVVSVPPNPGLPEPPTGTLVTHRDGTQWCRTLG
jgi:hypothetical protein